MCRSRLEREAEMLARSVMYDWRTRICPSESQPSTPETGGAQRLATYGEYVCRGLDLVNNVVEEGASEEMFMDDDHFKRHHSAASAAEAGIESGAEDGPSEEDMEKVHNILADLKTEVDKNFSDLPAGDQLKLVGNLVQKDLPALVQYSLYKSSVFEITRKFGGGFFRSVSTVMQLTCCVLQALHDSTLGVPLTPQLETEIMKHTSNIITDLAKAGGMSDDTSIVSEVLNMEDNDDL
eukprot:scpid66234/ scgid16874/ 